MAEVTGTSLERGAIGLPQVVFQSVTYMAPAAAVGVSITFATVYAGGSTPLAVAAAVIAGILVAVSIGQLAQHMPSAGGLVTYSAKALGEIPGFFVAWIYILGTSVVAPFVYLIFANVISANLHTSYGTPTWLWAILVLPVGGAVWFLGYRNVRVSTGTGIVLGLIEIFIFLALAITLIFAAGGHNTLTVFAPHTGNAKGFGSVIPAMIYASLALAGFEAAAPLAEETANPRQNVPRAVFGSCLVIGLFYVFCYYAATVYFGPSKMANPKTGFVTLNGGDPWTGMADRVWAGAGVIVILAIANSALANANAGLLAGTRVWYSLARIRILPSILSRVHPRHRTPVVAVHVQGALNIVVALIAGFATGSALNGVALLGTIFTFVIIPLYILTNLSNIVYHLTTARPEFNWILHGTIPALGIIIFIPVLVASAGFDFAGLGIAPLAYPASLAGPIVGAWLLLGIGVYVYYRRKDRARLMKIGVVFLDEDDASDMLPTER